MEQRPALATARGLRRRGPGAPRRRVPRLRRQQRGGLREEAGILDGGLDAALHDRPPYGDIVETLEVAGDREPERRRHVAGDLRRREPPGHGRKRQAVQRAGGERRQLCRIEARRIARDVVEREQTGELVEARHRLNGVGRSRQHRQRGDGECLDSGLAQAAERQGAGSLREAFAVGRGQEIVVGEARHGAAERLRQLDLHRGVGDMVLPADHVGDPEVEVIDDRGQRVEEAAVLAHQHGVAQRRAVDAAGAAHAVVPGPPRRGPAGSASAGGGPRPPDACDRRA